MKVMSVFGTRAEASKMAPVVKALQACDKIESIVAVTAQHRQQLDQVLSIYDIKPDYDLNIMTHKQTLAGVATVALNGLGEVFAKEKPDLVLVHGDTTTTFAASLAAFYAKIKVGHVEAGLRTYDKMQPFPEEMNRKLTTALADLHFAPTELSKQNLLKENVPEDTIFVTGNTAVDCMKSTVSDSYVFEEEAMKAVDFSKRVIALTAHRSENLGEPLLDIFKAVKTIVERFEDVEIVYSVHMNPAVSEVAFKHLSGIERVHLVSPPLDVQAMHNLMYRSYLVLTDSGGLQEEAPGLDKPVVVLRNVTERPEGLTAGTLVLAGTDPERIVSEVSRLLTDTEHYEKMARTPNPYGDGHAAERIVEAILQKI